MDEWRAAERIIDLHQHLDYAPELLGRAAKVMDASGIGLGVDLTPGTVTPGPKGEPSEFQSHKAVADKLFPGRWIHYMNLDYGNWDQPDFAQQAVRQVEEGHRLGAAGFKQEKSLGLFLRDGQGKLLKVDDPKLDPMWERLGELNMPVSIHTGDPKAFFEPYNDRNERWKELKDHPRWWFGDTNKYPTFHAVTRFDHPGDSTAPAHDVRLCAFWQQLGGTGLGGPGAGPPSQYEGGSGRADSGTRPALTRRPSIVSSSNTRIASSLGPTFSRWKAR